MEKRRKERKRNREKVRESERRKVGKRERKKKRERERKKEINKQTKHETFFCKQIPRYSLHARMLTREKGENEILYFCGSFLCFFS